MAGEDAASLARAFSCLVRGNLAYLRGSLDDAEHLYAQAEERYRAATNHPLRLAQTVLSQANLARFRERDDVAERLYGEAGHLFAAAHQTHGVAQTLLARGDLARRSGHPAAAEPLYFQAEQLFRAEHSQPGLARTLLRQGHLARLRGHTDPGPLYAQAEQLFRALGDQLGLADALRARAEVLLAAGGIGEARVQLAEALAAISVGGMPAMPTVAVQILALLARCHLAEGAWSAAWTQAERARHAFRGVAAVLPMVADRAVVRTQAASAYSAAVTAAIALGNRATTARGAAKWRRRAWTTAEEGKSAALLGLFEHTTLRQIRLRRNEAGPDTRRLLAELDRTESAVRALLAARADVGNTEEAGLAHHSTTVSRDAAAARDEFEQLQHRREALLSELFARHQRLARAHGRVAVRVRPIQRLLRQQRAGLVSYARLADGRFAALVLRPDDGCAVVELGPVTDETVHDLLLRQEEHGARQHLFGYPRTHWTQREVRDRLPSFHRLGQALWAPLETSGALDGIEHLYVVPDGWLRLLPFAAMTWIDASGRQRQVVEDHTLTVLLGGSLLSWLAPAGARLRRRAESELTAVIDPGAADLPPIPGEVVRQLEQALGRLRRLPRPVDRHAFAQAFEDADGVVYLGHGDVGGLALADGRFTAHDVLTSVDARGPALIGACLLGFEHALHGLAGASVITALHYAGCPAVLGALWEVPPFETATLLADVVAGGADWASALRQAQLRLRAANPDPHAWAGFVLYGLPYPGRIAGPHRTR